jgi:dinuclear metal center YbgI/SA1388 family protein
MAKVQDVLAALESIAPTRYAFGFDKVGLQVGDPNQNVERAVVSLDRSLGAVAFAAEAKAQLLVAHHPLIFRPLDTVDTRSHEGRTVVELIRNGTSFVAAHTNWDSARGGINDTLADLLELSDVTDFGHAAEVNSLKLVFFVPAHAADSVIDAVSGAGGGVIGAYARCAFANPGTGTFDAGASTNPAIGAAGERTQVDEVRVEMLVPSAKAGAVTRALVKAHPYEEPAYDLHVLRGNPEQPAGRVGSLAAPTTLAALLETVGAKLGVRAWAWGDADRRIRRVAVVGGAADGEWVAAQRAGADVLVTGEVKQHVALEAAESGFALIAAGHYQTEHPGCATLRDRLAKALPEVDWRLFTPAPGQHGRPL